MKIRMKVKVDTTIFEEICVEERVNQLFKGLQKNIHEKIQEVLEYIEMESMTEVLKEDIYNRFKENFLEIVLKKTTQLTLEGKNGYDILTNLMTALSEENLTKEIQGKPMMLAFSKSIRMNLTNTAFCRGIRERKISLLKKKFSLEEMDEMDNDINDD